MSTSELPGFNFALSLPSPTTSPFACTFPSPPASPLRSTSSTPSPSPLRSSFPSLSFPRASSLPFSAPNSASVPGAIPTSTLTPLASIPDAPAQRVVRKPAGVTVAGPPPAFPYNARYPPPDPADPFAPLSVLRSRTSSTCPPTPASVQPPAPYASPNRTPLSRGDGTESDASASASTRRRKRSAFDFGLLPFPKDEREREKGREREQGRTFALTRGFGPSFGAGTSRASLPLVAQMEMQAQDQYMSDQEVRASRRTSAGLADRHGYDSDGLHAAWDQDRTHLDRHVGAARQLSTTGADPRRRSHSAFAAPLRPRPASVAVSPCVSASSSSGSGPRLALIAASASRSESDSSDSADWSLADPVMPPILPWLPSGLERKLDGPRASAVKRESFVHVRGGKASRHSSASSISSTSLYSTRALSAASSASSSAPASAAFSVSVKLSSQDQDQDQNSDQQQDPFSISPHARQLYQYKDQDPKQQDLYQHQHHPSNSSNHVPSVAVAPNTFIAPPALVQRPTPAVDAPPLPSTRPPSPRIASVPIFTPSAFAITPSASATTPSQLSSAPESTSPPVAVSVPASASASVSALTSVATASTSHSIAESNCQIELKPDVHAFAPADADTAALFASAAVSLTSTEGRRLHILQVDPPPPPSTSASNIVAPVILGTRVPVSTSAAAVSPPARVRTPIYLPLPAPSPVPQLSKRHSSPPASPADHFFVGSPTPDSVHTTTHIITATPAENQKPRQAHSPTPTPTLSRLNSKMRAVSMDNLRLKSSSPAFFSLSKPSSALVSATPARGTNTGNDVKARTGTDEKTTARANRKSISGMSISSPLPSSLPVPMPAMSRSPTPSQPTVDIISITAPSIPSTINSVSRASSPAPTPFPKGAAPPRLHQQNKQEQQYSAPPLLARSRTLSFASRLRRTSQNASHSPSPVPSISASVTGAQHAQRTRAETQLHRATSPACTTTPATITESVRSTLPQSTATSRNPTPIPALHSRSQIPAYALSHLSAQPSTPHTHLDDHVTPFQGDALPARAQLAAAAALPVIAESGVRVPFGDLWADARTVVLFIRHFWCPLCQDYLFSVAREVEYARLRAAGVRLIIVGCGSYGLIKSYRQIFHMPYPIYTDPSLRLHRALGMTLRASPSNSPSTPNFPHISPPPTTAHSTHPSAPSFPFSSSDSQTKQNYVKHGLMSGFAMVVRHALRVGMPVWERGGDAAQLGGEFVLGPGLTCMYAHRMRTRRGHEPILTVLSAAGVSLPHWHVASAASSAISATSTSTSSSVSTTRNHVVLDEQEAHWMAARRRSLARMRSRKAKRRGEIAAFDDYDSEDVNGGDYEYAMYEEGEAGEEVVLIERKSVDAKEASREVEMGMRKRNETWEGKILSIVPEEAGTAISSTRNSSLVAEDGQTIDGDSNSDESGVIVGPLARGGRGDMDNNQEGRWVADADGLVKRAGGEGEGEGVKEIRGCAM